MRVTGMDLASKRLRPAGQIPVKLGSVDVQTAISSSMALPRLSEPIRRRASLLDGKILTEIKTLRRSFGYGFLPRLGRPIARFFTILGAGVAWFAGWFTDGAAIGGAFTASSVSENSWPATSIILVTLAQSYTQCKHSRL